MILTWARGARLILGLAVPVIGVAACTSSGSITAVSESSARPATTSTTSATSTTEEAVTSTTADDDDPATTEAEPDDDSTTTTEAGNLPRACDLLTEDEVTEALGEPVVTGDERADECWWSSVGDLKTVNVIRRTDDLDTWRRGYQNDSWERNDFGDEGYSGNVFDSIVFRIGEVHYEINVIYSTTGDPDQVVLDLARKVESRL